MRVAHFDCFSGISGDMTLAALIDIGVDRDAICSGIASLGLPIEISIEKVRKGGFASTFVEIVGPEETTHRFLPDIQEILSRGKLSARLTKRTPRHRVIGGMRTARPWRRTARPTSRSLIFS